MLGCHTYQVAIAGSTGAPTIVGDLPTVGLQWGRIQDETSQATVDVGECCDMLAGVRAIRHSVLILADGQLVWGGPIVRINWRTGRIVARDVSWWFDRRVISQPRSFVGQDLSSIAETLLRDAFAADDPGILTWLDVQPCGIIGDREYSADSIQTVGDAIRELARTGMDFTVLGWRVLIGPEQTTTRRLGVLTDQHFMVPPDVIEDGLSLTTRAWVQGSGVLGVAGGTDPYYGLVERSWNEPDIKDVVSAAAAAQTRVDLLSSSPVFVGDEAGNGFQSVLAPSAPFSLQELVPGAIIRTALTDACRQVAADLRLHEIQVRVAEDEQVSINLQPLGTV